MWCEHGYQLSCYPWAILETLDDETHWEDYTHQILAYYDDNLSRGHPVLTITDDNGEVVQELQIPQ